MGFKRSRVQISPPRPESADFPKKIGTFHLSKRRLKSSDWLSVATTLLQSEGLKSPRIDSKHQHGCQQKHQHGCQQKHQHGCQQIAVLSYCSFFKKILITLGDDDYGGSVTKASVSPYIIAENQYENGRV